MQVGIVPSLETVLIQDVILTLANLRGALDWLSRDADLPLPPAHRNGLERIALQISGLEERARAVFADPVRQGPPDAAAAAMPAAAEMHDGVAASSGGMIDADGPAKGRPAPPRGADDGGRGWPNGDDVGGRVPAPRPEFRSSRRA